MEEKDFQSKNQNKQEQLQNTKAFIQRRCQRDHFKYLNHLPTKKMNSLYQASYSSHKHPSPTQNSPLLINKAKMENSINFPKHNKQDHQVSPLISGYRQSYRIPKAQSVVLSKQKPSYFLKNDNFDQLKSEYQAVNQKTHKISQSFMDTNDKGKPISSCLGVAKYNKLSKKSVYRESYQQGTTGLKLPSIQRQFHDRKMKML